MAAADDLNNNFKAAQVKAQTEEEYYDSLNATNNHYDVVGPFVNTGPLSACVTITLSSTNGVQLIGASYNGAFDPTNFCTNYAGDPGGSANGDATWEETVPSGGSINVVVWEVTANQASAFNAGAGTGTILTNFAPTIFPGTITPILVMNSSNMLAGITMVPGADVVRLYDISNTNSPLLLDRKYVHRSKGDCQ